MVSVRRSLLEYDNLIVSLIRNEKDTNDDSTDLQTLLTPQDDRYPNRDRSNSSFDLRHRWITSAVFTSPFKQSDPGFTLEVIADAFNLLNRFNVSDVNPVCDPANSSACQAGQPTVALDPRTFQLALRINW